MPYSRPCARLNVHELRDQQTYKVIGWAVWTTTFVSHHRFPEELAHQNALLTGAAFWCMKFFVVLV